MTSESQKTIKLPPRPNPIFSSIKEFTLGEELGEGAIATVYLGTHNSSGVKYAVKDVNISTLSEQDFENVEKELEIHITLNHPHIIQLHDFFMENDHVYIILDFAAKGNLFKFLTKNNPLKPDDIGRFWIQTVKAIEYLHSKNILMRDLKPENLLLSENMSIKICDFGWATRMDDFEYKKLKGGTFAYMSPETLDGREQGTYSDVWSLGILLFELYHNREPFTPGDSCDEQLYFLKIGRIVYKMGLDRIVSDIIEKLLKKDPEKRITIPEIFKDPFTLPYLKGLGTCTPPSQPISHSNSQKFSRMKSNDHLQNKPQLNVTKIENHKSPVRSFQKSNTSFTQPSSNLQKNLLSFNTIGVTNYNNQIAQKQVLASNQSVSTLSKNKSYNNLLQQNGHQLTKSHTTTHGYNLQYKNSEARLINQTSMGSEVTNKTNNLNEKRENHASKQQLQNGTTHAMSSQQNVIPERTVPVKNNIKDIISYYRNKDVNQKTVSHTGFVTVNRQGHPKTQTLNQNNPLRSNNNLKTNYYQNRSISRNITAKPQGVIKFSQNENSRKVIQSHQPFSQNNVVSRPITNTLAKPIEKPVIKPVTNYSHKKTNSYDISSLSNNLASYRHTQPITYDNDLKSNNSTFQSKQSSHSKMIKNHLTHKREKSTNRKINLQEYKFMRASKLIPNYSMGGYSKLQKPLAQKTKQTLNVPVTRTMTKNRSYNDLQAYKVKMEEEKKSNPITNNYSQKFSKGSSRQIYTKPQVTNEYGFANGNKITNGRTLANGRTMTYGQNLTVGRNLTNGRFNVNGVGSGYNRKHKSKQGSVRKINLATYHRSYNQLK
jgi:serine/threonine protein kinase